MSGGGDIMRKSHLKEGSMPYIITEPVKIPGTKLGYAIYPFQNHFLDKTRPLDENMFKLYIFELQASKFIEVKKTLYQKELFLSMRNSNLVDCELKKFIMNNEEYITNLDEMMIFLSPNVKKMRL